MTLNQSERMRVNKNYNVLFQVNGEYGVLVESGIAITNTDGERYIITEDCNDAPIFHIARKAKSLIENKEYSDLLAILESSEFNELCDDDKTLLLNTVIIEKILMDELDDAEDMKYDYQNI